MMMKRPTESARYTTLLVFLFASIITCDGFMPTASSQHRRTSNTHESVHGTSPASFSYPSKSTKASTVVLAAEVSHWLDVLKFGGSTPSFDVIEKTKQYTSEPGYRAFNLATIPTDYFSDEYVFRGPIIGPVNRKELVETNTNFELFKSFPDLDRGAFGFTVDPENPYRVMFFERWKATHTGELNLAGLIKAEATGNKCISPVMPYSVVWTPEGTIIYEHLTTALDRFEGNTMGKVAAFGLFETAGISIGNTVGDPILTAQQKFNRLINGPAQAYSKAEDVPSWWKSKAVGAEVNDF